MLVLAVLGLAAPHPARAFDAGLSTPVLENPLPGAVSRPFEIPVAQSAAVPQPLNFEISVAGFEFDPDPVAGRQIGSLDLVTDSGDFDDKEIYSNGPGQSGSRTWTFNWQLADPITATVEDGVGLDANGNRTAVSGTTLISFTVPGNYHGFRLTGLSLRFNQGIRGAATEGIGAINPPVAGSYLIRSRIESVPPQSEVSLSSTSVRVGPPVPTTRLATSVNRSRVRPGGRVRISVWTTNQTRDTVAIWLRGRRLGKVRVGPDARHFHWRVKSRYRGQKLRFRIRPLNGPPRQIMVRVKN